MSREVHVRFRESVAVQLRRATRPVAESFFATLKGDLIDRTSWPTKARAVAAIIEYIACFYNPKRRHSTLGSVSPMEYEITARRLAKAA
jgi:transposase InsO family protein